MKKYGFVYIWFDRYRSMYYIGCHWGLENDGYLCSSNRMRDAYRRRPHDFKRRIIDRTNNREELFELEYKWLKFIKPDEMGTKYYNLKNTKGEHWSKNESASKTIAEKISETKKRFWASTESDITRKKMSDTYKIRGIKPPSRKGISSWNKGLKKENDERVMKNSLAIRKPKSNTENMGRYNKRKSGTQ
jgi:hypothetical protein